MSSLVPLHF